jgi:hypothetical protein
MMRPAPKLLVGSGRNLEDSLPTMDGAMTRRRAEASCVNLFQDGPQRVNSGGQEHVLPTGLPREPHSLRLSGFGAPPGKQNGDPRHPCADSEFTIATRRRPQAHEA